MPKIDDDGDDDDNEDYDNDDYDVFYSFQRISNTIVTILVNKSEQFDHIKKSF